MYLVTSIRPLPDSMETIYHLIEKYHLSGIDRIVPIGEGLSMDLIWDGYDIITTMSRIITVQ